MAKFKHLTNKNTVTSAKNMQIHTQELTKYIIYFFSDQFADRLTRQPSDIKPIT